MDLMDDELRRVLAGYVEPPADSMARELARLRARDRGPTATEMAEASRPSFRMSSAGKRQPDQRGGGAALDTLGSAILGSVPAGLAGLGSLLSFQGPEAAAKTVGRVQDYLTLDPQTEGGDKALLGIVKALAPLGAPAQAVGDVTLRATGSPLAATAAEIMLDPLNAAGLVAAGPALRAGARSAGRNVKRAGQSAVQNLGPKVAELAESYMQRTGMAPQIFVGKSSKTWDAASNARAAEMEAAGIPPQTIWRETGNWRAPDGQWRQEISDAPLAVGRKQSTVTPEEIASNEANKQRLTEVKRQMDAVGEQIDRHSLSNKGLRDKLLNDYMKLRTEESSIIDSIWMFSQKQKAQSEGMVGDLVQGPLLEAYPSLASFKLKDEPQSRYELGAYDKKNKSIVLRASSEQRKPVFVHEGQHFVQDVEGFSPGYAPTSESVKAYQDYLRYMGEAEARAAEARMNLTPEERRAKFPEESYDVPIGELIDAPRTGRPAFAIERGDVTRMTTPELEAEAASLSVRVNQAYESGNQPLAERLDARLESVFDALEHRFSEVEEDGPAVSEFDRREEARYVAGLDEDSGDPEADLVRDLANRWKDMTTPGSFDASLSDAEKAANIRMLLDDYAFRHGGLREGLSDQQFLDAAKDAYESVFVRKAQRQQSQGSGEVKKASDVAFKQFTGGAPVVSLGSASKHEFQTGKPVVIEGLHGTKFDFAEIDPARSSAGYFMTDRPVVSDEYAGVYPEGRGGGHFPTGGNVQRTFVRMDNPLFVNARGASFNRLDTRGVPGFGLPMSNTDMLNQWAKQQGYDGVIYKDLRDSISAPGGRNAPASNVFVSFKPNYVKSATGNRGTYDIRQRDMTKAQGGAVEGSDMSYSQAVDRIKSGLVQGGMDSGQAMDAALRMAEARMKAGGAVMMAGGGDSERELVLQARNRTLAAMDRALAPRARKAWDGPMPNRPVVNGRAMVSAEELADFRRQFGADKTLRDLLNADKGRGPSAADPRARGPQGASEAPASLYSDPSRVMEGVAASQREIAAPGRDAVEPVVPELALALAPRIAQLLGVSASALRARLTAAGKDWRNMPPRGADRAKWDAIVKQIDEAYPQAAQRPARVETPPLGTGRSAPDLEPTLGPPQPAVRGVMERPEPMLAGGGVPKVAAAAAARAAARAEARLAEKAAKEAAEKAAQGAATPPRTLTGALRPAADPVRGRTSLELLAQQRQVLTPEQRDILSDLRRKYPDFGESTKFMTPQEIIKVVERPENAAAMNRLLQVLPSSQNLAAVAKAGEPKRGWYRASTQAIIDVFGLQDAPRFSALLAAMSPQTSVEMNLLNTLNTWKNWTAAGRPNDPAEIRRIMGQSVAGTKGEKSVLQAWAQNATRALTAQDPAKITLSGPKVDSFYRNLADDVYRVTNDAWMASGLGVSQNLFSGAPTALQLGRGDPGLTPGYMATSARMREAGQRAGILPSEAQETTWSFFMPAYEMQRELNLPARDILQRGLLTPERIRGTPDFATLLGQGKYGDILKQAGYEEQLSRLTPTQFGAARTDLSLPEQREIEAAAQRLEALRSQRGAESRSRSISLPPQGQAPQTAFAVEPHEYIPGAGVRLGESMVTAPLGTREHYSSAISSLFRDPAGRDRLQRAVGLNPLPTRAGTGAFRPSGEIPYQGMVTEEARGQRMPVESQPAFASVAEVPVVRGGLDISQKAKERLGAAAATRGYLTGQHGSTYNVHIPRASGESFMVPLEGKADPDAMRYTYQLLDDAGYLADTGAGVNVLFNKYKQGNVPFTPQERTDIQTILGGQGIVPGRNVSEYIDYSPAWMGPEGSGAATRELLGRIEPLSGREKTALSKETQDIAGGLYDLYTKKGEKTKDEYRSDVMRALEILRDKGLPGLAAALAAGEALPSQEQGGLRKGSR